MNVWRLCFAWVLLCGCAAPAPTPKPPAPPAPKSLLAPGETHFAELRQLTFGGENAEAYWSFDGQQLSFQARAPGEGCDRIYRMSAFAPASKPIPVSSGKGATTCAFFLPGDQELVYASTHLGGEACPPRPDMSQGYVWALYDSYDIFRANADGSNLRRLTETPGYDAEATVCPKDGSIVFTSVRDGDLELYRMDADGKNVKRLTSTPGYDGGAFFSPDCSRIVWRASRPKPGKELEDYRALLAKGLVRPSRMELYVANADGSEPVQLTYLGGAAFAPYWHPSGKRILFSSNHGEAKGREFDLWAVDVDGTRLERITTTPGFDGFPMFSPDGKWLAFSSNRATAPGQQDTNVFLARWVEGPPATAAESGADRIIRDIRWLADLARGGRGIGTAGLQAAGEYLEQRFSELGLEPAGEGGGFRQPFPVTTRVSVDESSSVELDGTAVAKEAFTALGFSAEGEASGPLVLAGYGLSAPDLGVDDYAKVDARGKVVVVRRFVPESPTFAATDRQRRYGDLRHKAWVAREKGAKALVVVDWPVPPEPPVKDWQLPTEAKLAAPIPEGPGDAGLPVVMVTRAALEKVMAKLQAGKKVSARVKVRLSVERKDAFNVVGLLPAGSPEAKGQGALVIGAHYDHLGEGGRYSLSPDRREPHVGADDNASGVATLLEIARELSRHRDGLKRDVLVVAFSGEESGVLGSTHFTRARGEAGMKEVAAMLNLDMVGRLRANRLSVLGSDSAAEWKELLQSACDAAKVECAGSGDGYGPSDQTPFYAAGVPVLHFFSGAHPDYHKVSDTPDRINAAGSQQVALIVAQVARAVGGGAQLTYRQAPTPAPLGDLRSFNASLGTIPDYAGPPGGAKGVLLAGVRSGGAADQGGMRRGDVLVRLGKHDIGGVEDLMYALNAAKPGETVNATVVREGREVRLEVTFQESRRR
ncbi:MAG TPA: M28 family peptidase [Myxococcaceae bacterium]|nr:M28 family peptidase [Myxococcaceae bacterium]